MSEKSMAVVQREQGYVVGIDDAISPTKLLDQVKLIQTVMASVMKDGEHYGKIPGCGPKPSLLKPGAEKLCFTFRLDPEFDVEVIPTPHPIQGHREYRIKCTLFSIGSGNRIGSGVGSASTMETKWRFRTGPTESTGKPVPTEYWNTRKTDPEGAQKLIGGRGFTTKKTEAGAWEIFVQGEKVENENPADVYNTVLKMAKKRAMVDAVLTCTAASDIFTQDVEELVENEVITTPKVSPLVPQATDAGSSPKEAVLPTASTPVNQDDEHSMRDYLLETIEKINAIQGSDYIGVVHYLTKNKEGKFAKNSIDDIPWTAPKSKSDPSKGEWSPLKATISKAEKLLSDLMEVREPGQEG